MLFLVAAMERDLIRERTMDGLHATQGKGRLGGRPAAVTDYILAIACARRERSESVSAIARHLGIGRSTPYRALNLGHDSSTAAVPSKGGRSRPAHPSADPFSEPEIYRTGSPSRSTIYAGERILLRLAVAVAVPGPHRRLLLRLTVAIGVLGRR
jgi:hypothetical protein